MFKVCVWETSCNRKMLDKAYSMVLYFFVSIYAFVKNYDKNPISKCRCLFPYGTITNDYGNKDH